MATIYPLVPRRGASRPIISTRPHIADEDDSIATLSLIARQFNDAAGGDGSALILRSNGGEPERVLAVDGVLPSAMLTTFPPHDCDSGPAEKDRDPRWLMQKFPVSRDGGTQLLLATFFERACGGARAAVDAEARFRPIFEGVARLWGNARAEKRRLAGYAAALNHADMGVVLLNRDSEIVFSNAAADSLLDAATGVRRRRGSLVAADLNDAVKLQLAINHVVDRAGAGGRDARTPLVALKAGPGIRPLLISVLSPDVLPVGTRDVAAILYLCDPELDLRPLMQGACRLYRLSPVETRLASTLAGGCTLAEAATELRIKEQTARSYLKQIFVKTETRRQGELIRVLLTSVSRTTQRNDFDVV